MDGRTDGRAKKNRAPGVGLNIYSYKIVILSTHESLKICPQPTSPPMSRVIHNIIKTRKCIVTAPCPNLKDKKVYLIDNPL